MQRYPAWKMNILIFIAIAVMVGGYSFWQVQRATKQFLENSHEHAGVVAAVVELTLEESHKDEMSGHAVRAVEAIQQEPAVMGLLERLNRLPGIANVQLQGLTGSDQAGETEATTRLILTEGRRITETIIPLAGTNLVVALPAVHFSKRIQQMKGEFLLFAACILFFGCLSTWWLYRIQQQRIQEAREFERRIARQHEEAALGRAAATITHEIRNPLNAIGMGLQRLEIEAGRLEPEHLDLVAGMREAVVRSNAIVSNLKRYVGGFLPTIEAVDVAALLAEVMQLYRPQCDAAGIVVHREMAAGLLIEADRKFLGQLFENLLKNAVEAQPDGGRIAVSAERREGFCCLVFENDGFSLGPHDSEDIFEPYFTTKAKGTGLGLAISKKIVEAHEGRLVWQPDLQRHIFRLVIELPLRQGQPRDARGKDISFQFGV